MRRASARAQQRGGAGETLQHEAASGLKPKDLIGIPWMLAFALRADGWYLRQDIIWHKPNPMPESIRDRCTKAHEYVFLLSKSERYYFDAEAMREDAVGKPLHDLTGPGYKAPGQAPNTGNRKALRTDIESRHRSQIQGGQSLMAEPTASATVAASGPSLPSPSLRLTSPRWRLSWQRRASRQAAPSAAPCWTRSAAPAPPDLWPTSCGATPC